MSLRYILGNVGSGKTNFCINEIIKKDDHKNKIIYIVPEQFSMESEKILLRAKPSIINTGVYSFKRLAFTIMNSMGLNDNNVLNDAGRAMLLQKSLLDVKSSLNLYQKSVNQRGFTDSLGSTITELMQYNVSPSDLNETSTALAECNLKYKLNDIEKIYTSYSDKLKNKYISAENTLDILTEIISKSDMIKNSEIWIDGFKSFTPQEYRVIAELLIYADRVNIALTANTSDIFPDKINYDDTFYETTTTLKKLNKISEQNNIKIDKPIILKQCLRYSDNKELLFLSQNYFNNKAVYNDKCNNIKICNAKNKYDEIENVCIKIKELTRDKHYRYDEIAVIIGSEEYETPLCNTLNRYEIPNFLDARRDITGHPLTQTILSALEIISTNFSIESVFSFLKSPFVDIPIEDVFLLENYVLAQNIKGSRWFDSDWKYGFDNKNYTKPLIEDIRDIFIDYISVLYDKIKRNKKYTVLEISEAIFALLKELDVETTLNKFIDEFNQFNDRTSAMIDTQIWGSLCDVFEKMVEFLGTDKVNINQYINILSAGLESSTMGVIPALGDHLIIGDIERTRLPEIKVLFILGVNDGILPPQRSEAGIFSDNERTLLKYNYFDLAPELNIKLNQDKFNIYIALTKPSQYLYLSYSTSSISGKEIFKSAVITRIEEMFPNIKTEFYEDNKDNISSPLPVLNNLVGYIRNNDVSPINSSIYQFFKNSDFKPVIENIINITKNITQKYLPIEIADTIYPYSVNLSVSKLEKFAECPYSFFLKYVLYANERYEYQFKNLESGNIYHAALEYIFHDIKENNIDLSTLDKEKDLMESMAENAVKSAVIQTKNDKLSMVPRYTGFINRMKRTLVTTIWNFSQNAKTDKFKPTEFELIFDNTKGIKPINYKLDNDKSLNLTGKIDRIDHLEDKNKIYIRIIDYKSGKHSIDFNTIYNGMDIQLLLYINAYINSVNNHYKKDLEPAGVLYYTIQNPQLKTEVSDTDSALHSQMLYSGITATDSIVIEGNGDTVNAEYEFSKEDFEILNKFIDNQIIKNGNEIAKGNIDIKPYRYVNGSSISTGCDYCEYKSICKIDLKEKGKFKNFVNDKSILDKIKAETTKES